MKILTLSNYYPEHPGGIEFVALNLVRQWRKKHQVRWIACDVQTHPHVSGPGDVPLPAFNFTEDYLGFPFPIPFGMSIFEIIEQVKWCDVVHINDSLYVANIVAFMASRWHRKPLLVTQHVAIVPYTQGYKNILQKWAYATIGRLVLENAEKVVFISERVKSWFEAQFHFHQEPSLVPNGVDQALFYPPTSEEQQTTRTRLGFLPNEIVCLFVGRFTQKKGLHIIREMAQAYPHTRWLLIGRDDLDPRNWHLENVQVISYLSQRELRQYYIASDLFVLPSVGEGFPLAVQEALSCGLPTAVSKEIADHVPDAPLIKLDLGRISELLKSVGSLFTSREELLDLRKRSVEYAKRWDWANVALQYEDFFTKMTAPSS